MNLQSLEKEVDSNPVKIETRPKDNSSTERNENNTTEKAKTSSENILIKEPNLFQLRDFFKEKANETSKAKNPSIENKLKTINENAAKTIGEQGIKITKSTEGVIKLIRQPSEDAATLSENNKKAAIEPVKDFIKSTEEALQLKMIIEEEFKKAKEGFGDLNKESQKDFNKPAEEKPVADKQQAKTIIKPIEEKRIVAKEPGIEITKAPEPINNINKQIEKTIINLVEEKNVSAKGSIKELAKAPEHKNIINKQPEKTAIEKSEKIFNPIKVQPKEIFKTTEAKNTINQQPPKEVVKNTESLTHPEKKSELEVDIASQQSRADSKSKIRELSSLSIEDKKSYFKTQKEPSSKALKRSLMITIGLLILSVSFIVYSNFSDKSSNVKSEKLIAKTIPVSVNNKIEQTDPNKVAVAEEKTTENAVTNTSSVQNVKAIVLPPPPELPDMIETSTSTLADNFEVDNKEAIKKLEEQTPDAPPKEVKKVEEEPSFFVAVEEMPEPIGGLVGIQKRIVYPKVASLTGVEGKVYVRALVNESGDITNAEVIKGIGAGCDEAALDAILKTKFKPGVQRGKPVKVQVTIPIVFKKN